MYTKVLKKSSREVLTVAAEAGTTETSQPVLSLGTHGSPLLSCGVHCLS